MTSKTKTDRRRIWQVAGSLAALALSIASTGIAGAADSTTVVQGLTVHRGADILAAKDQAAQAQAFQGQATTGSPQRTASGVTVARGQGWRSAAGFEASVAAAKRPRYDLVAGEGGWFIDHEAGRLINCFRERAAAVGSYRIRCSSRALP